MERKRNGIQVMAGLIGMVRPLLLFMLAAVALGCLGHLAATFLTILAGYGLLTAAGLYDGMKIPMIAALIVSAAVLRGLLRYGEQAGNHYIAFKLLARIRHEVFASLRKLAPAKLEGSEKGNLISIITSDIELLEVFYAHTISPIAIAAADSFVMCLFIGRQHPAAGGLALVFYLVIGVLIPVFNGRSGSSNGREYRETFGRLNTTVLDNLYGLGEILQFGQMEKRMEKMEEGTAELTQISRRLKKGEIIQRIVTDWGILSAGGLMLLLTGYLVLRGEMEVYEAVISVIAIMSSFGPVAALASLSNNLNQTLASGNRVLNLLNEEPAVEEVKEGCRMKARDEINCEKVTFGYNDRECPVLKQFTQRFAAGRIHGIYGKSGCGKSTLIKLLMRFYEAEQGTVCYGKNQVGQIQTDSLRRHISYVTQETFLFRDTIENNIKVADGEASREAVIEAAKKASIHEFITSLPDGYDTMLSELGDSVSGGERQRIGLARAFLHDSPIIFLDEPASNIDSLNEGIILESLQREKKDKTMILVSHRESTMGIADRVLCMSK